MLELTNIRVFILDEADKLLSPEFQESIKYILFHFI
jgi:superfamily II DNA/RNA helicase